MGGERQENAGPNSKALSECRLLEFGPETWAESVAGGKQGWLFSCQSCGRIAAVVATETRGNDVLKFQIAGDRLRWEGWLSGGEGGWKCARCKISAGPDKDDRVEHLIEEQLKNYRAY